VRSNCQDGGCWSRVGQDVTTLLVAEHLGSSDPVTIKIFPLTSFQIFYQHHKQDFYRTSSTMPSRGNPNVPNKQRRIASRAKVQKRNSTNKISKNPRGTAKSSVLHPTSGPSAPVSGKKARKLERAQNKARRRAIEKAMEQEGEVEMTGKRALQAFRVFSNSE
jgi:hypothetical protein